MNPLVWNYGMFVHFSIVFRVSKSEVKNAKTGEFVLDRETPPGVYQYKFIVDGEWFLGGI